MREKLLSFLEKAQKPFAVVSAIPGKDKEAVIAFLLQLGAPVYLESISGIREDDRLKDLRITHIDNLWEVSARSNYNIDAILRIGGVPTFRPWRDLEDKRSGISVLSISHLPFIGLSRGEIIHTSLGDFFNGIEPEKIYNQFLAREWLEKDRIYRERLEKLFDETSTAEPSLIYKLSQMIPEYSLVYLGNSLPIREWDLAATYLNRQFTIAASRGLNGIDGQVSTFLGMSEHARSNWGIFGDLTTLYDLAGPWILPQLHPIEITIVVINNGGGKIFGRKFSQPEFQNQHHLGFEPLAKLWNLPYTVWKTIPGSDAIPRNGLIEIIPDPSATTHFWKEMR